MLATVSAGSVVLLAFGAPVAQLIAWAVREQISPRGTPLVDRFPEYLRHSASLTGATVALCVVVAVLVTNAHRFVPTRLVAAAAGPPPSGTRCPARWSASGW